MTITTTLQGTYHASCASSFNFLPRTNDGKLETQPIDLTSSKLHELDVHPIIKAQNAIVRLFCLTHTDDSSEDLCTFVQGCGVVINRGKHVLTANHVIKDSLDNIFAVFNVYLPKDDVPVGKAQSIQEYDDGMGLYKFVAKATLKRRKENDDLAVYEIVDQDLFGGVLPGKALPNVRIADAKVTKGQEVFAIGWVDKNRFTACGKVNNSSTLLPGTIENPKKQRSNNKGEAIQSTCKVAPGDSGGGIFNDNAELIGINLASSIIGGNYFEQIMVWLFNKLPQTTQYKWYKYIPGERFLYSADIDKIRAILDEAEIELCCK